MLRRTQVPGFGSELRALICSAKTEDKEIAGIVASETKELACRKARGNPHPQESILHGEFSEIHYLQLYRKPYSIRVYFTVIDGVLWMLALDPSKRRDFLSSGMEKRLLERLKEAKIEAAQEAKRTRDGVQRR